MAPSLSYRFDQIKSSKFIVGAKNLVAFLKKKIWNVQELHSSTFRILNLTFYLSYISKEI
jgi:hypothetical protein